MAEAVGYVSRHSRVHCRERIEIESEGITADGVLRLGLSLSSCSARLLEGFLSQSPSQSERTNVLVTAADILNRHSLAQLRLFGAVKMKTGSKPCALYVAVPREQAAKLDVVLNAAGLLNAAHVIRMHVPETLLRDGLHAA